MSDVTERLEYLMAMSGIRNRSATKVEKRIRNRVKSRWKKPA